MYKSNNHGGYDCYTWTQDKIQPCRIENDKIDREDKKVKIGNVRQAVTDMASFK